VLVIVAAVLHRAI